MSECASINKKWLWFCKMGYCAPFDKQRSDTKTQAEVAAFFFFFSIHAYAFFYSLSQNFDIRTLCFVVARNNEREKQRSIERLGYQQCFVSVACSE